ncbi:MAG: DUF3313 family protein [Allosphingosinicella sp.]
MKAHPLLAPLSLAAALALAAPAPAAQPPASWDGLSRVAAKSIDALYLLPGADFRTYAKVKLEPAEVAFRKNWVRDQNSTRRGLGGRISDADARRALDAGAASVDRIFAKAFAKAGYQMVDEAGADVLSIKPMVLNIAVAAPENMSAGRIHTFSVEAGQATVVVEARDSLSHQLLGRAVDAQTIGDRGHGGIRNRASNVADFEFAFADWAKRAAAGLARLRGSPPTP